MTPLNTRPLSFDTLRTALRIGWQVANATLGVSIAYAAIFALGGVLIMGGLLLQGWTPFVIAGAGAFMLIGPAVLAGFFGIAQAHEVGESPGPGAVIAGFSRASGALWALALVCGLLFMIFITDAAILYAYMVGAAPVGLAELLPTADNILRFVRWAAVSGLIVAILLFTISAFSVPLLCDCRCGLVDAVMTSARIVLCHPLPAFFWAFLLSTAVITSILCLPLLPLALPWLAYASRALYQAVLPGRERLAAF